MFSNTMVLTFIAIIGLPFLLFRYVMWRGSRLPKSHPNNYISNAEDNREVILCYGDSITHGRIGYDWCGELSNQDNSRIYINAGVNGDLAWNLNQRLDDIINCRPNIITILIGSNDAMGSQSKLMGDDYVKRKALPRTPSIDWYKENYELIIKSLIDNTNAKIYLITLPWIGELENEEIIEIIKNHNNVIKGLGRQYNLEVIPFFDELHKFINNKTKESKEHSIDTYLINYKRFYRIVRALFMHYLFGFSWNAIGRKYGLVATCDFIHLNEDSGRLIKNLIKDHLKIKSQ